MNKIIFFFQICTTISVLLTPKCLNESNQFYCKLGTRTPYRFIANYNESLPNYAGKFEQYYYLIIIIHNFSLLL
jgi:hypothetical protein